MARYRAPLAEMRFLLDDVLDTSRLAAIPSYADSAATLLDVAADAARLVENELAPLRTGSDAGCGLVDGEVITPPGYRHFYARFVEDGWAGLTHRPEHGGSGLPFLLGKMVEEMLSSANVAFALYPALTSGCYEAIGQCASEGLKAHYLPRLATGEWTGTMCLTEPQAGSDLAAIRTRAVPQPDGSYRIDGSKIFITSGEHDLTDNIVHFVLARLPEAPPGIRGLSTFVVPKVLPDTGLRNAVRCVSLEHKMGMHGSATCTLAFEHAQGWLAGRPHEGIQNMFVMMNLERIGVGVQGLGLCELATQSAVAYARERRQGRAPNGRAQIIEHPDVRRMLLRMKAITEASRLMAYETAMHVDLARHHPDSGVREAALDWVELTTPLVKSACTDAAFELGSLAIQVHGGHGYIREQGVEQIVRDAKILALYEGTNGIQAMDLARRKLQLRGGRLPRRFFDEVETTLQRATAVEGFIAQPLAEALVALRRATRVLQADGTPALDAAFGCDDLLRAWTLTLLGWNWLRMVRALDGRSDGFAQAKRVTAQFFATRMLPQVSLLCRNATASAEPMLELEAELF
ncbi:MAG TPA: acyl-CoA dehydrogenase [Nevskiaceae bacterium]|nr:acyl-CoA dehydrogenase [Nevskiaceae bacterium]